MEQKGNWLTAKEAAGYLGVHVKTLYELCEVGGLRHTRLTDRPGAKLRFQPMWLDEFLTERSQVNNFS